MSRNGYFLIADITGYTDFFAGSELEHAQGIVQSLLTTLTESIAAPLRLAKLEGDAVFCYAPAEAVRQPPSVLDIVEDVYCRFARALERIRRNTTCPCSACRRAGDLDLKFVLHYGEYAEQSIAGRSELAGTAVIAVHRLLKNRVREATGIDAYVFATDAAGEAMGGGRALQVGTPHGETIDGLGALAGRVLDMAPVWQARRESERAWVAPDQRLWFPALGGTLPIAPSTLWSYLLETEQRLRWVEGMTGMTIDARADGRIAVGSTFHCAHGKQKLDFEIVDWRPFESVSMDLALPFGLVVRSTFDLTEARDGTRCDVRLKPVAFGKSWLARAAGKLLLTAMGGKLQASYQRSMAALSRVVAEDLAAGRVERQPTGASTA